MYDKSAADRRFGDRHESCWQSGHLFRALLKNRTLQLFFIALAAFTVAQCMAWRVRANLSKPRAVQITAEQPAPIKPMTGFVTSCSLPAALAQKTAPPAPFIRVHRISAHHYKVVSLAEENSIQPACDLLETRIISVVRNGTHVGFELLQVRENSIYHQLGFQKGDILKSINGLALSSPEAGLEAYSKLKDSRRLILKFERAGSIFQNVYELGTP